HRWLVPHAVHPPRDPFPPIGLSMQILYSSERNSASPALESGVVDLMEVGPQSRDNIATLLAAFLGGALDHRDGGARGDGVALLHHELVDDAGLVGGDLVLHLH